MNLTTDAPKPPPTSLAARPLWRVMVVDDSPEDREEIRRQLIRGSDRRYQFEEVELGATAIARCREAADGPPDCMVLDFHLPDMDAVAVLAALAGDDGIVLCPVVVLTGTLRFAVAPPVFRAGAQDFLGKEWMTPASMTLAVENAVARWALTRDLHQQQQRLAESEAMYRALTEEAAVIREALRESARHKDEFLATLSHELRNPMAAIAAALSLLSHAADHPVHRTRAIGILGRQTKQLERLIDDLLDVTRISSGKLDIRPTRIELADVINQAAETATPLCQRQGHRLTLHLPAEPVHLTGDGPRLIQVFGNLLNNACKFTDPNGQIELTAIVEHGWVRVGIRDNGIGIAPEDLTGVFGLFAQSATSLRRPEAGLGIGLSLVKKLVELHGGRVEALSAGLGKGSEVVVHLPLVAESGT